MLLAANNLGGVHFPPKKGVFVLPITVVHNQEYLYMDENSLSRSSKSLNIISRVVFISLVFASSNEVRIHMYRIGIGRSRLGLVRTCLKKMH